MFLTGRALSRRTVLRGLGASVALPLLDAMVPARAYARAAAPAPVRLICIEMVHGSAGSTDFGAAKHLWAPASSGRDFDLGPTSLRALEPWRRHLTIVSNTDVANAEPFDVTEVGGDHARSSAVFLTQAHPKRTLGGDVEVGTSLDQIYARRFGQDTVLPSVQLAIEPIDAGGGCGFGYSCTYTDSLSWATPTRPLPMVRDPRAAFDLMFGGFGDGASSEQRRARLSDERSILDWIRSESASLMRALGPGDRARLVDYLDHVREIERRLRAIEVRNTSGEPRALPEAPAGVPDSFTDHVRLMFDLQVLALQSDVTRVIAFKMGRDNSNRVYPESGFDGPFHPTSHHSGVAAKILDFAKLNAFHVGQVAYLLDRLQKTADGDGTMLDHSLVLYGSAMGDSNQHNHTRVPFFLAGHAGGRVEGGRHITTPRGTPLANAMLGVLHALGFDDMDQFGDSTGAIALR